MRKIYCCLLSVCIIAAASGCTGLQREWAEFPADDAEITKIIREEIAADPELNRQKIGVVAKNGDVILHGTVQTRAQESRIIKFALRVKGVRSVEDTITVLKK